MPCWRPMVVGDAIGTWLITSTPPATTRSWVPERTAWAAKCSACCDEPHCLSIVVAGTDSGKPADRTVTLPMFEAWGPTWPTQPQSTSSISAGSTPAPDQRPEHVRAEVGGMHLRQRAVALADRRADG